MPSALAGGLAARRGVVSWSPRMADRSLSGRALRARRVASRQRLSTGHAPFLVSILWSIELEEVPVPTSRFAEPAPPAKRGTSSSAGGYGVTPAHRSILSGMRDTGNGAGPPLFEEAGDRRSLTPIRTPRSPRPARRKEMRSAWPKWTSAGLSRTARASHIGWRGQYGF